MQTVNWGSPPAGLFNFPLELWAERGEFVRRGFDLRPHTHLTGIESLSDCDGAPFVINKYNTCPHSLLKWHARQYELSEDDFQVITLMADSTSDNYGEAFLEGVRAGRMRAGILYEPWVSLLEREFGWQVLADYPRIARPANYAFLLYARRDWIEHKPELVAAVVDAYFESARDTQQQEDALASYAEKFSFIQPDDVRRAIRREAHHWQLQCGIDEDLLASIEREVIEQKLVPTSYRIADHIVEMNQGTRIRTAES